MALQQTPTKPPQDPKSKDPAKAATNPDPKLPVDQDAKEFEQRVNAVKADFPYEEEEFRAKMLSRGEEMIKRVETISNALKRVGMPGVDRDSDITGSQAWSDRVKLLSSAVAILNKALADKRITPEQFKSIEDGFIKARTEHFDAVTTLSDEIKRFYDISSGPRSAYSAALKAFKADRSETTEKALYEACARLVASDTRCAKFEKRLAAIDDKFFEALDIKAP